VTPVGPLLLHLRPHQAARQQSGCYTALLPCFRICTITWPLLLLNSLMMCLHSSTADV
jgi:hypothetical protein